MRRPAGLRGWRRCSGCARRFHRLPPALPGARVELMQADPQALRIKTVLNGQVMQDHTTGDMIFSVTELIEFLSQDTTLLPGTVILTGTPQGVGFARDPQIWLRDGDRVIVEVEGIGQLENPVVAAGD